VFLRHWQQARPAASQKETRHGGNVVRHLNRILSLAVMVVSIVMIGYLFLQVVYQTAPGVTWWLQAGAEIRRGHE